MDREEIIRQIDGLIRYHEQVVQDARLYRRPTEQAIAELTVKYLKEAREAQ